MLHGLELELELVGVRVRVMVAVKQIILTIFTEHTKTCNKLNSEPHDEHEPVEPHLQEQKEGRRA